MLKLRSGPLMVLDLFRFSLTLGKSTGTLVTQSAKRPIIYRSTRFHT